MHGRHRYRAGPGVWHNGTADPILITASHFKNNRPTMFDSLLRIFRCPPSRDKLAHELLARLKQLRPDEQYTYDAAQFTLRGSGGQLINLGNVFLDYSNTAPKQRAALLEAFLAGFSVHEAPASFDDARPQLLPVIRHVYGLESSTIEMGDVPFGDLYTTYAMQPFAGGLAVGIAFDTEHAVIQVGDKTLAQWNRSLDDVLAIAIDNLRHKAAPQFSELSPGLFVSQYGDFYDAARILLPEIAWQLRLNGHPVAMIPNRTCLLITGDQDAAGLSTMISTADQVLQEQSRPLSADMFRLDGQAWQPWTPPGEPGTPLHNLRQQMLAVDYQTQQDVLRRDYERQGIDVFVASFGLAQNKGETRIHSYSVMTKDVESVLPKTDVLILNRLDSDDCVIVPWEAFADEFGDLLERLPHVLPRYRVKAYPSESQLMRLRELAVR